MALKRLLATPSLRIAAIHNIYKCLKIALIPIKHKVGTKIFNVVNGQLTVRKGGTGDQIPK